LSSKRDVENAEIAPEEEQNSQIMKKEQYSINGSIVLVGEA
jgi:hypothetical protein